MTAKGNVFNNLYMQVWRQTAEGVCVGQLDPQNLVAGQTSHAYLVQDPVGTTLPTPSYTLATFRGGGRFISQQDMGLESLAEFTINLSGWDAYLNLLLGGSKVDTTTVTGQTFFAPNSGKRRMNRVGLLLTGEIESRESATAGEPYYFSYFIPSARCRVRMPNLSITGGENPNQMVITVRPQMAKRFPTGVAFGTSLGLEANEDYIIGMVSQNPMALSAYIEDDGTTSYTYTLGYLPVRSDVTSGNTRNWFTRDKVVAAPTSVNTTTAVVTYTDDENTNDIDVALYETGFEAVA